MSVGNSAQQRIAILAAMSQELAPIVTRYELGREFDRTKPYQYVGRYKQLEIIAAVTKMGLENAEALTHSLFESEKIDHVILVGIAGAISSELDIGQGIRALYVIDGRNNNQMGMPFFNLAGSHGALYSSNELHYGEAFREAMEDKCVIAIDMEAGSIAQVCKEYGCSFTAVKAVSDRIGDIPEYHKVYQLAHEDGSPNVPKVIRFIVSNPHRLGYLAKLALGTRRAIQASAAEAEVILEKIICNSSDGLLEKP